MRIQGLILGKGDIITDGRTLRGMATKGHIQYPVDKGHPYVDHEGLPRRFEYKGKDYSIDYFSGCFYPFVIVGNFLKD